MANRKWERKTKRVLCAGGFTASGFLFVIPKNRQKWTRHAVTLIKKKRSIHKHMNEVSEIEFTVASEVHSRGKESRTERILKTKQKKKGLYHQLLTFHTSSVRAVAQSDGGKNVTGRIRRSSHSRMKKWMKKQTSHIVRKLPASALPKKGNMGKLYFDYWWNWY